LLARAPVFDGVSPDRLERLAARAHRLRLHAGSSLFEAGDPSDGLYVVAAGRLEVVDPEHPDRVLRVLGAGAVVGELGTITGAPRSATVRARRDSELLAVAREDVEVLLREGPGFAFAVARNLARQLAGEAAPPPGSAPDRRVVTLVGVDAAAPVDEVAQLIAAELGDGDRATRLNEAAAGAAPARVLEAVLATGRRVLLELQGGDAGPAWTSFCLRAADLVVAIAGGGRLRLGPRELRRLHGCELLACGPIAAGLQLAAVAAQIEPRRVQAVPAGPQAPDRVRAVARRLAGRSIGVVLSGGGAKGFAHLGVLEELEAAGVRIDRVAGASQGGVIASLYAKGLGAAHATEICERSYLRRSPTGDWTFPVVSLIRGRRTEDLVREAHGEATLIEELALALFTVSSDLLSGELVVHRRGSVVDAVCASVAIPGVFPPRPIGGRLLVDGGMRNNLPVDVMAADHEGPVIAVDVVEPPQQRSGAPRVPRLAETLMRSVGFASVDRDGSAWRRADLVIAPAVAGIGILDWKRLHEAREAGRAAAREALATAPPWLAAR
jgi:NTE family protein